MHAQLQCLVTDHKSNRLLELLELILDFKHSPFSECCMLSR